jgi:class 3 adenylate cyclase
VSAARLLVVDDTPANIRLLEAVLSPRGYAVDAAASGAEALERLAADPPDLVLLDVVMPGMDGYEVCRRIRAEPATRLLPVVMVTATPGQERVQALEAGADDFLPKPIDQAELLARVGSLVRIKRYHDTIERQAAELRGWNEELERRVDRQVAELLSAGDQSILESHRREITVVFCDLRGFTAFAETVEPEDMMAVLREYHAALGELAFEYEGTLERFTGDGLMVFFNDPVPCTDAPVRAVRMALGMRNRVRDSAESWRRLGHRLGFGVGIAQGYATLGRIGFEGRWDYAAIGTVTNLAARLCDAAEDGQILVSPRVHAALDGVVAVDTVRELTLKGFSRPVTAHNVVGASGAALDSPLPRADWSGRTAGGR